MGAFFSIILAVAVVSPLKDEIALLDSQMFAAFNAHNVDKTMSWFTRDLEFYHDKDGLLTYDQVTEGFTKMFAQNNGIRRDLVPGSLEVYPIKDYGAVEFGSHKFCHVENGKDDCGVFRFVLLWRNDKGSWSVARAISYDHR